MSTQNSCYLGLDVGGTKFLVCLQVGNNESTFKRCPTGPDFTIETLIDFLLNILKINKINNNQISGIGIAICGFVDNNGIIGLCELPKLTGINIKQQIIKHINTKISIINDAKAALNVCINKYPKEPNLGVIVVGTGVGSAFKVDGKILEGFNKSGGFLGACPIVITTNETNDTKQTNLKTSKLVDQLCGGRCIVKLLSDINVSPNQVNIIMNDKNNKLYEKVKNILYNVGYYLGISLCIILNMLDCHRIIFAGGVLNFPLIYDTMIETIKENIFIKEMFDNYIFEKYEQINNIVAMGSLLAAKTANNMNKQSNKNELIDNDMNNQESFTNNNDFAEVFTF